MHWFWSEMEESRECSRCPRHAAALCLWCMIWAMCLGPVSNGVHASSPTVVVDKLFKHAWQRPEREVEEIGGEATTAVTGRSRG